MKNTANIGKNLLNLEKPLIMGILNTTPDSFYKDSRINSNEEEFLTKANQMVNEGVNIFDIGGYSTRPGHTAISIKEELTRIIQPVKILKEKFPHIPISVDTFRAEVALEALNSGAEIINDISGGDFDKDMFPLIIEKKPVYIMMHLQGNINNMHEQTQYDDFLSEVIDKLSRKANYLRKNGVIDIWIDPGFGFSKTLDQNYLLLKHLPLFQNMTYPLLSGISRKSMVYKLLNITPEESLPYSNALFLLAIQYGTQIIRVHDVSEAQHLLKISNKLTIK